jgi:hypothetical protein
MPLSAVLTAASIAAQAAGVIASASQANKAGKDLRAATLAAEEFVKEAEKRLEVNEMERLAIAKEPYELQRQALLSQGTQAIEAGRESERGAAATAGRIFAGQAGAQRQSRVDMAGRMEDIQGLVAGEASRLRDVGMGINLEQAAGAQLAASEAAERQAAAKQQTFQGLGDLGLSIAEIQPLYTAQGKQARGLRRAYRKGEQPTAEQLAYMQTLGLDNMSAMQFMFQPYQTTDTNNED